MKTLALTLMLGAFCTSCEPVNQWLGLGDYDLIEASSEGVILDASSSPLVDTPACEGVK